MQPKLVSVAGPLCGGVYPLSDQEVTVGREPLNWLSVQSMRLSRRHCSLRVEGDQLRVLDLDSTNGTYVNDLPIRERYLNHGDQLRIGDCLFVFLTSDAEAVIESGDAPLSASTQIVGRVVEWRSQDGSSFERPEIVLKTLLQMSASIGQAQSVDQVQGKLLDLALEAIPADRAVILLFAEGSD